MADSGHSLLYRTYQRLVSPLFFVVGLPVGVAQGAVITARALVSPLTKNLPFGKRERTSGPEAAVQATAQRRSSKGVVAGAMEYQAGLVSGLAGLIAAWLGLALGLLQACATAVWLLFLQVSTSRGRAELLYGKQRSSKTSQGVARSNHGVPRTEGAEVAWSNPVFTEGLQLPDSPAASSRTDETAQGKGNTEFSATRPLSVIPNIPLKYQPTKEPASLKASQGASDYSVPSAVPAASEYPVPSGVPAVSSFVDDTAAVSADREAAVSNAASDSFSAAPTPVASEYQYSGVSQSDMMPKPVASSVTQSAQQATPASFTATKVTASTETPATIMATKAATSTETPATVMATKPVISTEAPATTTTTKASTSTEIPATTTATKPVASTGGPTASSASPPTGIWSEYVHLTDRPKLSKINRPVAVPEEPVQLQKETTSAAAASRAATATADQSSAAIGSKDATATIDRSSATASKGATDTADQSAAKHEELQAEKPAASSTMPLKADMEAPAAATASKGAATTIDHSVLDDGQPRHTSQVQADKPTASSIAPLQAEQNAAGTATAGKAAAGPIDHAGIPSLQAQQSAEGVERSAGAVTAGKAAAGPIDHAGIPSLPALQGTAGPVGPAGTTAAGPIDHDGIPPPFEVPDSGLEGYSTTADAAKPRNRAADMAETTLQRLGAQKEAPAAVTGGQETRATDNHADGLPASKLVGSEHTLPSDSAGSDGSRLSDWPPSGKLWGSVVSYNAPQDQQQMPATASKDATAPHTPAGASTDQSNADTPPPELMPDISTAAPIANFHTSEQTSDSYTPQAENQGGHQMLPSASLDPAGLPDAAISSAASAQQKAETQPSDSVTLSSVPKLAPAPLPQPEPTSAADAQLNLQPRQGYFPQIEHKGEPVVLSTPASRVNVPLSSNGSGHNSPKGLDRSLAPALIRVSPTYLARNSPSNSGRTSPKPAGVNGGRLSPRVSGVSKVSSDLTRTWPLSDGRTLPLGSDEASPVGSGRTSAKGSGTAAPVDNGMISATGSGKESAGINVPDSAVGAKLSEELVSKTTPASAYAAKIADSMANSSTGVKPTEEPKPSEKQPSQKQVNSSVPALADENSKGAKSLAPPAKQADSRTGGARVGVVDLDAPATKPAVAADKEAGTPQRADPYVQDSARERTVYGKAAGKGLSEPGTPEGVATLSPHHTPASAGYQPNRDAVNSPVGPGVRVSPISPTLSVGSSAYTESIATDEDHADRLSTVSELGPEGEKKKKKGLRKRLKKGLSKAFVEPFRSHKEEKATWK